MWEIKLSYSVNLKMLNVAYENFKSYMKNRETTVFCDKYKKNKDLYALLINSFKILLLLKITRNAWCLWKIKNHWCKLFLSLSFEICSHIIVFIVLYVSYSYILFCHRVCLSDYLKIAQTRHGSPDLVKRIDSDFQKSLSLDFSIEMFIGSYGMMV